MIYQQFLKQGPGYWARADPKPQTSDYINTCFEVEYPVVFAENFKEMNLMANELGMLQCIQGRTWTIEPDKNENLNIHSPDEYNSTSVGISDQFLVSTSNQNPVQQPLKLSQIVSQSLTDDPQYDLSTIDIDPKNLIS